MRGRKRGVENESQSQEGGNKKPPLARRGLAWPLGDSEAVEPRAGLAFWAFPIERKLGQRRAVTVQQKARSFTPFGGERGNLGQFGGGGKPDARGDGIAQGFRILNRLFRDEVGVPVGGIALQVNLNGDFGDV